MAANDEQVGGTHYKAFSIEPWDAIASWSLGYLDGCAVKYLARWRTKYSDPAKQLQDLKKARHYLDKLIEQQTKRVADAKPSA